MTTKSKVLKRIKEIDQRCSLEVIGKLSNCSLEIRVHAPDGYCFNDWGYDTYVMPDLYAEHETMSDVWETLMLNLEDETGVWHKSEAPTEYYQDSAGDWCARDCV